MRVHLPLALVPRLAMVFDGGIMTVHKAQHPDLPGKRITSERGNGGAGMRGWRIPVALIQKSVGPRRQWRARRLPLSPFDSFARNRLRRRRGGALAKGTKDAKEVFLWSALFKSGLGRGGWAHGGPERHPCAQDRGERVGRDFQARRGRAQLRPGLRPSFSVCSHSSFSPAHIA